MKLPKISGSRGFTLIEFLLIIIILGIVAAVAIPIARSHGWW